MVTDELARRRARAAGHPCALPPAPDGGPLPPPVVLPLTRARRRTPPARDALDAITPGMPARQDPVQIAAVTPLGPWPPVVEEQHAGRDQFGAVAEMTTAPASVRRQGRDEITAALQTDAGRGGLERELDRARGTGSVLVLAFLDVHAGKGDDGHLAGDEGGLGGVGHSLVRCLRREDVVVPIGRDTFIAALPGLTVEQASPRVAQVARVLNRLCPGTRVSVWLSAAYGQDTVDAVLARTESHLFALSRSGRARPARASEQERPRQP